MNKRIIIEKQSKEPLPFSSLYIYSENGETIFTHTTSHVFLAMISNWIDEGFEIVIKKKYE